jgi:hypothetical protein
VGDSLVEAAESLIDHEVVAVPAPAASPSV